MAFELQNFTRSQEANNSGLGSQASGANALFSYQNVADALVGIQQPNYFLDAIFQLELGDLILVRGTAAMALLEVDTITKTAGALGITTAAVIL